MYNWKLVLHYYEVISIEIEYVLIVDCCLVSEFKNF